MGKGKREGGLSTNVLEQVMTVSAVVAACQKRLLLQHFERDEYFHTNPLAHWWETSSSTQTPSDRVK